jgi:hypothetical protein
MQQQSDYRNHHQNLVMVGNNVDDEANYQRAAGILRDFHNTHSHCCPPLNVIHEDSDDDDDDSNTKRDQNERHLFEVSGLISRSATAACLTALAQQEPSNRCVQTKPSSFSSLQCKSSQFSLPVNS